MQSRSVPSTIASITVALVVCAGCQSRSAPHSLTGMLHQQARTLAAECYRTNEGFRAVHGGGVVWDACQRWARDRMRTIRPMGL